MVSKRCGCASDSCTCVITGGPGVEVSGGGTKTNPYVLEASVAPSTLSVEDENTIIRAGVTLMDFRGGVVVTSGDPGEVLVTVPVQPKFMSGQAIIPAAGALNTPVSVALSFPAGFFAANPVVVATGVGTAPQTRSAVMVASLSPTAATLWVTQLSGTLATTPVLWIAIG
jgi:hypothetical protein